ncbi:MAG TPA: hypothetical protein VJV79_16840 [Polyangiaceae bacterium]|nr:hypothetical protein [Polyangiaceae bacterium]
MYSARHRRGLWQLRVYLDTGVHGYASGLLDARRGRTLQHVRWLLLERYSVQRNGLGMRDEHWRDRLLERSRLLLDRVRRNSGPMLHLELARVCDSTGLRAVVGSEARLFALRAARAR